MNNQVDVTILLLQDSRVDPSVSDSWALRACSSFGSLEIVRQLLKGN